MSRDRLAEARAAAQSNNPAELEMTSLNNTLLPSANQTSYLDEISAIKQEIERFKSHISRIAFLNEQALNLISDKQQQEHSEHVNEVTDEAKITRQNIKDAIQKLANCKLADPSQENVRHGQYVTLKKQFMDLISNYQKVEQKHHQQIKARMERQYRIVCPDATDDEVKEAIESEGDTSLFAQSVLQSAQAGEAKRALKEVRERHMDIQNIVKSIEELNTLYHEMQYMVESQDVLVDNIDKQVEAANVQLEEVNVELKQATETALKSRKRKWFLTFLIVAILAVIIIIIVTTLLPSSNNSKTS